MNKLEKIEKLDKVSIELKKEFIGLDSIIDEFINAFKSWYITPEVNERPTVISLFGMTGTGKTSLVRRLLTLLELEGKSLFFDCGTESNDSSTETLTSKITKYLDADGEDEGIGTDRSKDLIFVFDEFQHGRTIDESGAEVNKSNLRAVWTLVDSGILDLNSTDWELSYLTNFIDDLKGFVQINPDLKVEGCALVNEDDIKLFLDTLGFFYYDRGVPGLLGTKARYGSYTETDLKDIDNACRPPLKVLEDRFIRVVMRRLNNLYPNADNLKTLKDLLSINGTIYDLYLELEDLYDKVACPNILDCSQSLVIILGNLDEAFHVEGNITPDLDPDIFYDETSKVSINDIKHALKSRFRAEQIARLGNTIIKYPTLRGSDFRKIIEKDVNRILSNFKKSENIEVRVSENFIDLLYSEGVYPAQGVRPVFTTISTTLTPLLSDILINKINNNYVGNGYILIDVGELDQELNFNVPEIHIKLTHSDKPDVDFGRDIKLTLGSLRYPGNRKSRYISSVHEIGHAVVSSYLTGKVPNSIISVCSDGGGFCTTYDSDKINELETRRDIKNHVMCLFAGYEAERLIFKDLDSTTLGSGSDLEKAWDSLSKAAYECGYFNPRLYSNYTVESTSNVPGGSDSRHIDKLIEDEFRLLEKRTKEILGCNKRLIIEASLQLGKIGKMTGNDFKNLIKEYGSTLDLVRLEEAKKENSSDYYEEQLLNLQKE